MPTADASPALSRGSLTASPHRPPERPACGNSPCTHTINHPPFLPTPTSMSAPAAAAAAESQSLTGVGPRHSCSSRSHASMPPEHLPVEIWHLIIMCLDDHCFAWFVLRQTCPFLNLVTEQVFARYVSRTCSVRFAGQTLGNLL